jgi:uncharacterized protein with ParB-like and HNH nuclease domain
MHAQITYIKNFLNVGHRYIVPVYQRRYAWGEESAEEFLKTINSSTDAQRIIGSITLTNSGFDQYLVDGQQRMTTISLLLMAVRAALQPINPEYAQRIEQQLSCREYGGQISTKIKLKDDDQLILTSLSNINAVHPNTDNKLTTNYNYFLKITEAMTENQLLSLHEKICKTQIVEILIDANENPQAIFESLNSKGEGLSDIELITNLLFMSIDNDEHQRQTYERSWKLVEQTLNSDYRSENFIKSFLSIALDSSDGLAKKNLYKIFKNNYLVKNPNPIVVADTISEYVHAYRLVELIDKPLENLLFKALKSVSDLNSVQPLPLLMVLLLKHKKNNLQTDHAVTIIRIVEAYIARRSLAGESSASHFKTFSRLALKINEIDDSNAILKIVLSYFSKLTGSAKMPRNEFIISTLLTKDFYTFTNSKYFFEIIINQIYPNYDITVAQGQRTIEHIMPQTLNAEWRYFLGVNSQIIYSTKLNVLGNLALIPQNLNSFLGQSSFETKKNILKYGGGGFVQPPYQELFSHIYNTNEWNSDFIDMNTIFFSKILLDKFSLTDDFFTEEMIVVQDEVTPLADGFVLDTFTTIDRIAVYRDIEKFLIKTFQLRPRGNVGYISFGRPLTSGALISLMSTHRNKLKIYINIYQDNEFGENDFSNRVERQARDFLGNDNGSWVTVAHRGVGDFMFSCDVINVADVKKLLEFYINETIE